MGQGVSGALSGLDTVEVILLNKTRELDGFGYFKKGKANTCFFKAQVQVEEIRNLKEHADGSTAGQKFSLYVGGEVPVKENDKIEISGIKYTVKSSFFWSSGCYTEITAKHIERRKVTNVTS